MAFIKFPFLLIVMFVLFTGGKIIPFLFVALGLWFVLGVVRHGYRPQPYPGITEEDLAGLRNDVAVGLLEVDDDVRLKGNREARSRFEAAGAYYATASQLLDRGVRRRDRDAVALTLSRAQYELEATAAALEGRPIPEEPAPPRTTRRIQRAPRRSHHRRHNYCGW
jgi:hypothetical protein